MLIKFMHQYKIVKSFQFFIKNIAEVKSWMEGWVLIFQIKTLNSVKYGTW